MIKLELSFVNQFKLHQKNKLKHIHIIKVNSILLQENYRFFNLIIFTNKNYFVSINFLKNTSKFDINNLIAFIGDNQ